MRRPVEAVAQMKSSLPAVNLFRRPPAPCAGEQPSDSPSAATTDLQLSATASGNGGGLLPMAATFDGVAAIPRARTQSPLRARVGLECSQSVSMPFADAEANSSLPEPSAGSLFARLPVSANSLRARGQSPLRPAASSMVIGSIPSGGSRQPFVPLSPAATAAQAFSPVARQQSFSFSSSSEVAVSSAVQRRFSSGIEPGKAGGIIRSSTAMKPNATNALHQISVQRLPAFSPVLSGRAVQPIAPR